MKATPLENFSSLHETSVSEQLDWKIKRSLIPFAMQFSLNLHTPLTMDPRAYLILQAKDADSPPSMPEKCFSVTDLTRWRLDISSYRSFDDYLASLARWHRWNYTKSKKNFLNYGCETSFVERDWSDYAEQVYHLYELVAQRYHHSLYDLSFFQKIAKRPDYKLLCGWFEGKLIAAFVFQEELTTLHGLGGGLDYHHSSASYAYSWMHYVFFEYAIAAQKFDTIDVGFNSDKAKKSIGFQPIPSRIDIYTQGKMTRQVLKGLSHCVSASVTSDARLKLRLKKESYK